ncbi:MAG: WD40 repeat domain-containing protein [Acidobacteria bacterium]|nr:WD40 repeat domain-containing protein [Acidobacteriota bacterium]
MKDVLGLGWVFATDYSPDGRRLAVAGPSVLYIINADSYEIEQQLFGHTHGIYAVRWSPDGKYLASGSVDTLVKIWDAESGRVVHTLDGHNALVTSVAWSPDGRYLASGGDFTTVIWEVETGAFITRLPSADAASVAWSGDGRYLAVGTIFPSLQIWDTTTWELVRELLGYGSRVASVAWSPDHRYLASGNDGGIVLWEVGTWNLWRTIRTPGVVHGVAWSPNCKQLASDRWVWDPATGDLL